MAAQDPPTSGDWFDQQGLTAPGPQQNATADAGTSTPQYSGVLGQIAQAFKTYTGKDPSPQQVMQWGTNIDPQYLQKIIGSIASTPDAQAYAKQSQTGGGQQTPPPPPAAGTAGFGDLTTSQAWMSLVQDPTKLAAWVQSQLPPGSDPSLVQYYVGRIQQSPGITPDQQAGGASYWGGRITSGGGNGGDQPSSTGTMAQPSPVPSNYTPAAYTLPSMADLENTPGYQFAKQQGEEGIQRNAVAKGFSGGTLKDLATFDTGLADQTYQQAVGNSLNAFGANTGAQQFGANYGLAANNQGFQQGLATNQFNLGAEGQFWGQGLAENQNAFNQYNTNQNTTFAQQYAVANLGNPGNPFA